MNTTALPNLVEVDWLAARLGEPRLRILDATVQIDASMGIRSGREDWERGHIPGSSFADLFTLSDQAAPPYTFTIPSAAWFSAKMGELGVGDDAQVVIYDSRENMWATRLWWMLRAFGFDNAVILNGGWTMWQREQQPICTTPCQYPPATLTARLREGSVLDKNGMLGAMNDADTRLVNALGRRQHRGEVNEYGRAGHIPGSHNVTAWEILDRETQRYKPLAELQKRFAGIIDAQRVVTYCGSGIACTSDAFVLHLLGHPNVAIYDGGLLEWCADPTLPLVRDVS